MTCTDLAAYVCGGFVVARPNATIEQLHQGYLADHAVPGPVITASNCIGDVLPADWMFSWLPETSAELRATAAAEWGIPEGMVADLVAWVKAREASEEMAFSQLFLGLQAAQAFVRRFLPGSSEGRVLAMALLRAAVPGLSVQLVEAGSGHDAEWRCPTVDLLRRELPLPPGGRPLGFEVLGISPWEERHSWHCHGIAREMHEQFEVLPGPGGLFAVAEDARRVASWCNDPASGTEPCAWAPWLLVEYGGEGVEA